MPAAVHMGVGPPGISYDPCCHGFRASLGNPAVLEEALNRHPKLRVNVMHGGWPYLQETIALLFVYPQVNVDLGAIDWALPRAEFHAYLGALMRAGFGRRIMFGSDQMYLARSDRHGGRRDRRGAVPDAGRQARYLLRQCRALPPAATVTAAQNAIMTLIASRSSIAR